MTTPEPGVFATCRYCGDAVPPGAASCPTCGETERIVTDREIRRLAPRDRRWVRVLQVGRILVVAVVAIGIVWAVGSAVLSGPPVIPDPLTTQGTLHVGPSNFTYLFGAITGEDWIQGNYTVVHPYGAPISFTVYNSSEFAAFATGSPTTTSASTTSAASGRILFAAPYTDTFYFVFVNPYPVSSGLALTVYEQTSYQTNVVIG